MEQLTCWVCCKELGFHALGACGHNDMCLYCACRLRILLKDYKCPICKTNLPRILITKNPNAKLEDYPDLELCKNGHGILCDSPEAQEAYLKIQGFNCWLPNCKYPKNNTMAQLTKHIESHKLRFCKICLKGRLIFIWEQKVYTQQDLTRHLNYGEDDIPRHRECLFCKSMHYDENELRSHLESKHFFCNFCEGKNYIYYENYEIIKTHYQKSHYMCYDPICAESKCSVFKTSYELQMHTYSFHIDHEKLTKAQKQQMTKIKIQTDEPIAPNTEGVDFSAQFSTVKKQDEEEEKKPQKPQKKSYKVKNQPIQKKTAEIVDYKNLPKQPEKEVIELIRDAMHSNQRSFEEFKPVAVGFNKGQVPADALFKKFIELAGQIQGEILFPVLITTVRSSEKQEELHREYKKYMESKSNITADGKCNNKFANCSQDASTFTVLIEVIEAELNSRSESKTKENLYVHPSQLIQMAAIVDKLSINDMLRLLYIMNFGIPEKVKSSIINMIERANDREFNETLQVKYEDYFLKNIEPQHLYIIHKYCDMCLAKLQGRPLKEDSKLLNNWEEKKSPLKKEEEEEEEEKKSNEKNWASVLVKKNAKAPSNIEKNFPSLSGNMPGKDAPGWGKNNRTAFVPNVESSSTNNGLSFPSLNSAYPASSNAFPAPSNAFPAPSSAFPSLNSAFPPLQSDFPTIGATEEPKSKALFVSPPVVDNFQYLKDKGFTVNTEGKKNRKRRGK